MSFLNSFAKALIIARAREKRVSRAMKTIEQLPRKTWLPLTTKRLPEIPAPRPLPRHLPFPKPRQELLVPKPGDVPIPSDAQLTQVTMPAPEPILETKSAIQKSAGYTKIVLPVKETEGIKAIPVAETKPITKTISKTRPIIRTVRPKRPKTKKPVTQQISKPVTMPAIKQIKKPITKQEQKTVAEINFGDITDFLRDPYVKAVEYDNGKLKIITSEGEKEHGTLSEEEAKKIIKNFAQAAGVKVKPAFEAAVGNIKMSAVLSEILGTKFVIEKL